MRWLVCALALCLYAGVSFAGAQREEFLADSVRTALFASVADSTTSAPPDLVHANADAQRNFDAWLFNADARLARQIKTLPHELIQANLRREFLQTVWYESQRAGLPPDLVLGLIQVESGFRKFAISAAGARGYMQVMPFWVATLSGNHLLRGEARMLFKAQTNLRFGCVILRHYLNLENGDLSLALGRYNGSRGKSLYPNAVLAARRQWQTPR